MVEIICKLPAWASTYYEPPKSSMLPPLGFSAPFIPPTWQEDLVLIAAFLGRQQSGAPGAGDKADGRRQDLPILGVSWPVSPLIKLPLEQHLEPQILKTLTRGQPLVFGVFGVQWSTTQPSLSTSLPCIPHPKHHQSFYLNVRNACQIRPLFTTFGINILIHITVIIHLFH